MKKFPISLFIFLVCLFFSVVFVAAAQETEFLSVSSKPFSYSSIAHPLRIPVMKHMNFPGSDIVIEEVLPKGELYDRYSVSYFSEHRKIYGVLAVPRRTAPINGFPAVLMAHVPPAEYQGSTEYTGLIDLLAKNGYVVFMPDLRGHGNSEGIAEGAYFSPVYTIDFLNAFASLIRHEDINPEKIGVWGHSMGGHIILRSTVIEKRIQSAVIWSGAVGSYADLLYHWNSNTVWNSSVDQNIVKPAQLVAQFGSFNDNPQFWSEISPTSYIHDISIPIQLHHSQYDQTVPAEFSQKLDRLLRQENKQSELYIYSHVNHDMEGPDTPLVLYRTLHFFNSTLQ
ncbi:MAG TPA: alpha/beta fold hydrolase [Candidatus Levybacteria bacterium]|nr:alpha/beta fold hydrolase [Candidatus Levybacteria bacterium]